MASPGDPADPKPPPTYDRIRFPLWLKLGMVFGAFVSVAIGSYGLIDFMGDVEDRRAERVLVQTRLAEHTATLLDADLVAGFRTSADEERPAYKRLVERLRWIRDANGMRWMGIYGQDAERRFYLVDAEDEDPLPLNYPLFESWPAMEAAFAGTSAFAFGLEDEYGRWDSSFAPIKNDAGQVVAVVTVDQDADWLDALRQQKIRRLAVAYVLTVLFVVFAAVLFSRYLSRHLKELTMAARAVAGGDLEQHLDLRSRDEIGVVADAFDGMVEGLRERDRIRDTFGRYVDEDVAHKILSDPSALHLGGELKTVTILMSDLRGFTSLSEQLSPAEMVQLLNAYLGRMGESIQRFEGTINEFIGDAILALFGAPFAHDDDPLRAVACAVAMQIGLDEFNQEHADRGLPSLQMGIGINTGQVIVGNIGSEKRMKYGVVGDDVNLAARIESFTVGGEVLVSEATRDAVGDKAEFRGPIEVRAKGKKEPIRLYAVVAVHEPVRLVVPVEQQVASDLIDVDVRVDVFTVAGKTVSDVPMPGRFFKMSKDVGAMVVDGELAIFDNIKLRVHVDSDDGPPIENVYGKVQRADDSDGDGEIDYQVRFTSVPEEDRARFRGLASVG